jgi:hypothetical protein
MLKTSSCLSETISFHFACRPLRATSVHVTAALASYPVSPRRLSKLRRGLPGPGKHSPLACPLRDLSCSRQLAAHTTLGMGLGRPC